ncbi:MAG: class I SAM-dependent methyltransferase [Planctomycetes bacterium]|nr:class I SAM-dependent methyltransferase [Planctomycetota bacterium]
MSFNRLVRRFGDDLATAPYAAQVAELRRTATALAGRGVVLRADFARDWEYAHVLLRVAALAAELPLQRVVDFGGGNSILAYVLAQRGCDVTVLDSDAAVRAAVAQHAGVLGLHERLHAPPTAAPWPVAEASVDLCISISVFESLLRRERAAFFAEVRRALRDGGRLLMTFDYGVGARWISDPVVSRAGLAEDVVAASGLELVGPLPDEPDFDPEIGPPVKALVRTMDGHDWICAAYTFGALELRRLVR